MNESKKEYVDRYRTAVRHIDKDTGEIVRYNPFPELMCSETGEVEDPEHEVKGLWFGVSCRTELDVTTGVGQIQIHPSTVSISQQPSRTSPGRARNAACERLSECGAPLAPRFLLRGL